MQPELTSVKRGSGYVSIKPRMYYTRKEERDMAEEEYTLNGEGCYIVDTMYSLPGEGRLFFYATRKFNQLGRYLNHSTSPNAKLTSPLHARGK